MAGRGRLAQSGWLFESAYGRRDCGKNNCKSSVSALQVGASILLLKLNLGAPLAVPRDGCPANALSLPREP